MTMIRPQLWLLLFCINGVVAFTTGSVNNLYMSLAFLALYLFTRKSEPIEKEKVKIPEKSNHTKFHSDVLRRTADYIDSVGTSRFNIQEVLEKIQSRFGNYHTNATLVGLYQNLISTSGFDDLESSKLLYSIDDLIAHMATIEGQCKEFHMFYIILMKIQSLYSIGNQLSIHAKDIEFAPRKYILELHKDNLEKALMGYTRDFKSFQGAFKINYASWLHSHEEEIEGEQKEDSEQSNGNE